MNLGDSKKDCLICGQPLTYHTQDTLMRCVICGREYMSNVCCVKGHFVCDKCHSQDCMEIIRDYCLNEKSTDPIVIAQHLMVHPKIYMHGPEHHTLVGAALLTAYNNSGGMVKLEKALDEVVMRGQNVPGGTCGFWGCCGAAIGSGIFISVVTETTPMSEESWGICNLMTSRALKAIGSVGGPRCCKRATFLTISVAVDFVREQWGIHMTQQKEPNCSFSANNKECIEEGCPFYLK